ncbi:MAG: orotidine-5'-phosphate decarboxylase [Planctomycetes bacterium]|nr:orotidine-5'-phosphate decarboxylase [Planctomycetota bacterium]
MPLSSFADQLHAAILQKGAPCCIGLDPRPQWLPKSLRERIRLRPTRASIAGAIVEFHEKIIDCIAPLVPAIKPQLAFFEQLGAPGVDAYERLVEQAHRLGILVIADAKRGDIGPTAEAYAHSFLGGVEFEGTDVSPPAADCLTINPFFGTDGVEPFLAACKQSNRGLYILVRTSNPSSKEFQLSQNPADSLSVKLARAVDAWGSTFINENGYSSIGAVVGATHAKELAEFRRLMPRTPFLLPGYGAQGGKADDIVDAFDTKGLGGLVVAARSVNFAYRRGNEEDSDWRGAIEHAAREMVVDVTKALRRAGKWNP